MSSTVSSAASAVGTAFAAAIAALTPTQLAGLFSFGGETQAEKSAMKLLGLYVSNMQANNPTGEATILAAVVAIQGLPNWFVDGLPEVWGASSVNDANIAIGKLQSKLDGNS
jgi:hypothetical protein